MASFLRLGYGFTVAYVGSDGVPGGSFLSKDCADSPGVVGRRVTSTGRADANPSANNDNCAAYNAGRAAYNAACAPDDGEYAMDNSRFQTKKGALSIAARNAY